MIIGGGGFDTSLQNNFTRYMGMFSDRSSNTESHVQQVMTIKGTVSNLYVRLDSAPGMGDTYTFTVRKNSLTPADTLVCEIGESATNCSDTINAVAFDVGDLFSIEVTESNNPSNQLVRWTARFTPTP
jgi:hypothetical protein